jgi:hypothetical protein
MKIKKKMFIGMVMFCHGISFEALKQITCLLGWLCFAMEIQRKIRFQVYLFVHSMPQGNADALCPHIFQQSC